MATCLLRKNPEVKKQLDEYTDILGSESAAYYVLSENNGYGLEFAPNGQPSKLFSDLLSHFNGDRLLAIQAKAKTFTDEFRNWFGDWLNMSNDIFNKNKVDYNLVDIEEYPKPWKNDPNKVNRAVKIYLKDQHEKGYFELVKDNEDNFYSVHFKTSTEKTGSLTTSRGETSIPSTYEERKILWDQLINLIPRGSMVSTWGELSEDGIYALNKFGKFEQFSKVGERQVSKKKSGDKINVPIWQKNGNISKTVDENGEPLIEYSNIISVSNKKVYHQTKENKTYIPRDAITDRTFKHIADTLARLFPEITVLWHQNLPEGEYGRIDTTDLEAITIMLSDNYQADTLPHEYAHRYIEMFRETPIVQKAIQKYGSEETLVQAIGEQVVKQKGDAYGFWKRLWEYIKAIINRQPVMKLALQMQLTNSLLQRKDLAKKSGIFQQMVKEGQVYFQKASEKVKDINKVRAILQEITNKIEFDEDTHTYMYNGQPLTAVSTFKQNLLYSVYDDSDISENQRTYNDDSRIIGTTIHAVLESMFNGSYRREAFMKSIINVSTGKLRQAALSSKALQQLEQIYKNISENYELVATEAILADFEKSVAGTTDLLLKNKKTGKFAIFDYKTKCIELDGKTENKDGKRLWGFSYVNKSKNGAKTATNAYDFQLGAYEHMLNSYGIQIDERGIIPIVYKYNSKTQTVEQAFFSKKMGSFEVDPKLGVFHIQRQKAVEYDIKTKVFGEQDDKLNQEYAQSRMNIAREIISDILKSLQNKAQIERRAGRRSQAKTIEYQIDQIGNASEAQAMMQYLITAIDQLSRVYKQIDRKYTQESKKNAEPVTWNLVYLRNYRDLALSFNMVDDIAGFVQRFKSFFTEEEYENLTDSIKEVTSLQKVIISSYKEIGSRLYMDAVTPYVKNIEANYRLEFERKYREDNRRIDEKEMKKWIDRKIEEIRDKIDEETVTWLNRQKRVADDIFECSTIAANIGNVFQARDPFVQAAVKIFDEKMQQADHKYQSLVRQMIKLADEYEKKYKGGNWSDHRKLYDDMVEIVDGQAYLVNEIPNSFIVARRKMFTELNNDHSLTFQQRQEAIEKWYDENAPIIDKEGLLFEFEQAVKEIVSDLKESNKNKILKNIRAEGKDKKSWKYFRDKNIISLEQFDRINEAYDDLLEQYRVINSSKYPNKKYDNLQKLKQSNDVKYRLWEMFKQLNDIGDKGVSSRLQLNYRLPGIRKEFVERVSEDGVKGVKDGVVQYAKEASMLVEDDAMTGQVFTDMNGNVVNQIPLFYNQRLNLDLQSFDLPTIYARWLHSALEHQAKLQIEDFMLMTSEILKNRSTETQNVSILSKLQGKQEKAVTKSENTYKLFASWLDQVFYGNQIRTNTEIGNISVDKLAKTIMKYYSMRVMGVNYISMINNLTVAELNQFVEAFGSHWIDHKSMLKASKLFGQHLISGSMLADIGKRVPEDFVNQLVDWFGIYEAGDPNLRAKGIQRLFTTDVAYWTTNIGERLTQTRFLLAALYKLKAVDKNGNELGSMIDYLSFNKNGELVVDDKVANFDEKRINEFSMGVRSTLMGMHGNYNSRWAVAIQQYIWGKLLLMFRKWIYTSFQRRFSKRYYDNIRGEWVEGHHSTLLRVTKEMFYNPAIDKIKIALGKQIDQNKREALKWNQLTTDEKNNLKKSITELILVMSAYTLSNVFRGLAEGDDDEGIDIVYMNIAYQLYRVYTDFSFYFNPWSFTQIIQNPFPVMSAVDNLGRLYDRLWHPTDVYTTGKNDGENKLLYSIGQMIPIYRQISRLENIQYEFDFLAKKN